jgi:hypothetical protein
MHILFFVHVYDNGMVKATGWGASTQGSNLGCETIYAVGYSPTVCFQKKSLTLHFSLCFLQAHLVLELVHPSQNLQVRILAKTRLAFAI